MGRDDGFDPVSFAAGWFARGRENSIDASDGLIIAGIAGLVLVGGVVTMVVLGDDITTKGAFKSAICDSVNLKDVDVKYFDWYISNDNEYLFKFTGSAINNFDEKIDFFSCAYEVSEKNYYDVLAYISQNELENIDDYGLLGKLADIVKESELKEFVVDEKVTTSSVEEDVLILDVTKPKVENGKVKYFVSHAQRFENKDGSKGIMTTLSEVSYDLTPELAKNPSGVFLMSKEKAMVKRMGAKKIPVDPFNQVILNNPTKDRVQVINKGKPVTRR